MRIVTDSASDLTREDIEAHRIAVAPLYITFPDRTVRSEDVSPDEFYDALAAMRPEAPTTSQPSVGDFEAVYRELLDADSEVLSIHISSGLSGTVESAREAARRVNEAAITVFDTLSLSGGERFHVLAAALASAAGYARERVVSVLEAIRSRCEVVFTLEELDYLIKGGRIGRVQGTLANLLAIKPVIHVNKEDGRYDTVSRARSLKRALSEIVDFLESTFAADGPLWVTVMHGACPETAASLTSLVKERLQIARLEQLRVSPVLGVHTGPSVVGACACPVSCFEGLV